MQLYYYLRRNPRELEDILDDMEERLPHRFSEITRIRDYLDRFPVMSASKINRLFSFAPGLLEEYVNVFAPTDLKIMVFEIAQRANETGKSLRQICMEYGLNKHYLSRLLFRLKTEPNVNVSDDKLDIITDIYNKIISFKPEESSRTLTGADVLQLLNINKSSFWKYLRLGLPHDRILVKGKSTPLFNAEEVQEWYQNYLKSLTHRNRRVDFSKPKWEQVKQDFLSNVPITTIRKKYHITGATLKEFLRREGLSRKKLLSIPRATFDDPKWEAIREDYLSGLPILEIMRKYHVSYKLLNRFRQQMGLSRRIRRNRFRYNPVRFWY